jgi:three-Cys-motif partner protein
MAAPKKTLWKLEEHSKAKHQILRSYLSAWLPIMSSYNGRLVLVDGFAGPGRYTSGEDGSPLVMLKAFTEHTQRSRIKSELVYLFIEEREDRAAYLQEEVAAMKLPDNVKWDVVSGNFQEIFGAQIKLLQEQGQQLAPTFAFVDPFGYTDAPMDLTASILEFRRCEVLIYVPLPSINRWIGVDGQERGMTALFGTTKWKKALDLEGKARRIYLHDLFREQLLSQGEIKYVRSFEIVTKSGTGGYHLFFGTGHETGLKAMKTAMWGVDPEEGQRFRDSTGSDQLVLMEPSPDLERLDQALRDNFGTEEFSIQDAEQFALTETPYLPKHIRKGSLIPAEEADELEILSDRNRRKTYPPGTLLRFRD